MDGPDDRTVSMSYGFGDCSVGCGYFHYWDFAIEDGRAELRAESGDELPPMFDECITWRIGDPSG
jgi:hypothetical protein